MFCDTEKVDGDQGMCCNQFGHRYYYWDEYKDNQETDNGPNIGYTKGDWYIMRKYRNLKEELLMNSIYKITMNQYNKITNKAKIISKMQFIKKLKIEGSSLCEIYKKSPGDLMQKENLMVLCLYTDFKVLSKHFRDTFIVDSVEKKQKNKEYWWWSKTLIETVQLF